MEKTNQRLPRSQPEAQGIRSEAIIAFLNGIQERQLELHSMMLLRHGVVVSEGWWKPYASEVPHMLFSLSKSFTSSAIGFAAAEGKLSLDDAVVSFFPSEVPNELEPNLSAMRIRHLLMMGTGHDQDTTNGMVESEDGNWVQAFLQAPVEHEPGTHFVYNSGATYMLSAILQKVTGQSLLSYLQPRLLEPLGIDGATWESCPRGIHVGGWGLSITTEDIAKFGQLYLQKGEWNGQRILQEEWVAEATSKQIANGDGGASDWAQGYGYQFWRCRHGVYRGDGAFGQYCVVMPEQDAVLVMTGGTNELQGVLDMVWEHLLPAMESSPLSLDHDVQAGLAAKLQSLTLQPPQLQQESSLEANISGETYTLEENKHQWKSIAVSFEDHHAAVVVVKAEENFTLILGRSSWNEGSTRLILDGDKRVFASFTWEQQDTLLITIRFTETPFAFTGTLQFEEGKLVLSLISNVLPDKTNVRGQRVGLEQRKE
ncbi:serine hydrolase domain-containing protein [Paenibacillus sinopodophylli]|uniref:serine hydrolase domain-containing protein n=1 Tax=Paenibacillus sinopodophylli TaxID=1837342 RepID=UPI00110D0DB1|nr:serine hydrolase [Paenibacillus sinopodophylli]